MNLIYSMGIMILLLIMTIGIGTRFNNIESNQETIITNQEQLIILLSPKYAHDVDDIDAMRIIKPKVSK